MKTAQTTSRQIIVVKGGKADCLHLAKLITKNLETLIIEDAKKANQWLGQEFDAVIFDTHNGFSPNAFGAVTGTIRGGGYLLLLKPIKWPTESLFLQRFDSLLNSQPDTRIISATNSIGESTPLLKRPSRKVFPQPCATKDQTIVVEAIIQVVKGHRRRPLVITSDRGRGKSAALGIAISKLLQDGYKNIIVCAPSKKTAAVIFEQAKKRAGENIFQFFSPDELQRQKPKADILLIDEAAAIPLSLLTSFLKLYSRIVFATTQHGYEGSGRGFAINFKKTLDEVSPDWKSCQLTTPIRWEENDYLEQFTFEALLLNAEPADVKEQGDRTPSNCNFFEIDKIDLSRNESKLRSVFGLLVSAHYQTKPSDFMQMLDDPAKRIFTLQIEQKIVAVALLVKEGSIDATLAKDIFEGTRRLKGHLVAQALAANVGLESAPRLHGERILRIAVHPDLQNKGLGTHLLEQLSNEIDADYLSTSFGATQTLLNFWERASYKPVYLSMKRDASSGIHSVIMLRAKSQAGKELKEKACGLFTQSFPHLLSDPFRNLETDIAISLLHPQEQEQLTETEMKILLAFSNNQRGYENSFHSIWKLVINRLRNKSDLAQEEKEILILKVLQKQDIQNIVSVMSDRIKGKKEAVQLLRDSLKKLLN